RRRPGAARVRDLAGAPPRLKSTVQSDARIEQDDPCWSVWLTSVPAGPTPPAPPPPGDLPVLDVSYLRTPCIAANIAAGISGVDPLTDKPAVTVKNPVKNPHTYYSTYPGGAPARLTYGRLATPAAPKNLSYTNRKAACGHRPFKNGGEPGPPDGKPNGKGGRTDGSLTSCDEYPYASSLQGGSDAIVRGVRPVENNRQGGELSAFLRRERMKLDESGGQFAVCVTLATGRVGSCP
ncbi:MAG: NucA/NucB deoxyribonuclease domain-containing protein, partial [Actinomycetota bacterium]|nr:NucA/NucB deoxyribonuclease domain-containing protein [Actinomycetota bacterium]